MTIDLLLLCLAAFAAGFIDAIVGGGGLVQTPAGLIILPSETVSKVIGTLKIPAFSGTFIAATQYARKIKLEWRMLSLMIPLAMISAWLGSLLLTRVSNTFMKPVLLVVLTGVFMYTYFNRKFGIHIEKTHTRKRKIVYAVLISTIIGFYDGFIGPGTGSFLVLIFIGLLGFDFLRASAHAKFINLATNLGSIVLFSTHGQIIYKIALPMALCNAIGGLFGSRLAMLKGNSFIRVFFLIVVSATILRFAYDVFFRNP